MSPVSKVVGAVLLLVCALVGASFLPAEDAGASASVGLVVFKGSGFGREVRDPFAARLKAHGSSAEVHVLTPTCDKVSRINSVRKLLAHGVGVLVVFGTCAAQDAAEATNKVPIVLLAGYDPTGGRPDRPAWMGNNVTGLSCRTSVPLLYENMHKTSPLETVGFLQCSDDDDGAAQLRDVQAVASSRDFQLIIANASGASAGQLARTFSPAQFVHVGWGCDPQVLGFDLERLGKPLVTQSPGLKGSGIVLSLAANAEAMIDEGAALAARLLKGERAANIPIAEAKKVDFLVDLQEALALGLRIPFEVLQANR